MIKRALKEPKDKKGPKGIVELDSSFFKIRKGSIKKVPEAQAKIKARFVPCQPSQHPTAPISFISPKPKASFLNIFSPDQRTRVMSINP